MWYDHKKETIALVVAAWFAAIAIMAIISGIVSLASSLLQ